MLIRMLFEMKQKQGRKRTRHFWLISQRFVSMNENSREMIDANLHRDTRLHTY